MRSRGTEDLEPRLPGFDTSGLDLLSALANELDRASASREQLTIGEGRRFLEAHCLEARILADDSAERFFLIWRRFERYASSSGVERASRVDAQLVRAFVNARMSKGGQPSLATKHLRPRWPYARSSASCASSHSAISTRPWIWAYRAAGTHRSSAHGRGDRPRTMGLTHYHRGHTAPRGLGARGGRGRYQRDRRGHRRLHRPRHGRGAPTGRHQVPA